MKRLEMFLVKRRGFCEASDTSNQEQDATAAAAAEEEDDGSDDDGDGGTKLVAVTEPYIRL